MRQHLANTVAVDPFRSRRTTLRPQNQFVLFGKLGGHRGERCLRIAHCPQHFNQMPRQILGLHRSDRARIEVQYHLAILADAFAAEPQAKWLAAFDAFDYLRRSRRLSRVAVRELQLTRRQQVAACGRWRIGKIQILQSIVHRECAVEVSQEDGTRFVRFDTLR